MADQTTSSITIDAPPSAVMAVIADFALYPAWAQGVTRAEVVADGADGRAREVAFDLNATPIRGSYTLGYEWSGDDRVSWTLVESSILRAIDGSYELEAHRDGTLVTYSLSVDLLIPMIGMLRRKAEKVIIDAALKGLKKRVESL